MSTGTLIDPHRIDMLLRFRQRYARAFLTTVFAAGLCIALPAAPLESPLVFVKQGDRGPKLNRPNLLRNEGVTIRVDHRAPGHARQGSDGALRRISISSQPSTSNMPLGATIASAGVLSALDFVQETGVISDAQIARLAQTYGPVARDRLNHWRALMRDPKNRAASDSHKLALVNDFMNRTPFKTDREHWGKDDYWAMPAEFLASNGGDCEDFAIAKYFTLRVLGVAEEKLQITYVKEINLYHGAHMVLAYFATPEAEPLILDNLNRSIQSASARTDLVPVYSFNGSGLWLAKDQAGRSHGQGSADRIVQWKDLKTRMKNAV